MYDKKSIIAALKKSNTVNVVKRRYKDTSKGESYLWVKGAYGQKNNGVFQAFKTPTNTWAVMYAPAKWREMTPTAFADYILGYCRRHPTKEVRLRAVSLTQSSKSVALVKFSKGT